MGWVAGGLTVICLGVAVLHLLRLAVRRRDVAAELSHAAMGLGMAAMFSPLGDPVPQPVWVAVFVLCAGWFAALALRGGTFGGDAPHHVVGGATMLFMLAVVGPATAGGSGHAGHAAHGGGAADDLGLTSVVAIVLTAYFAWHALRCADRFRADRFRADPFTADRLSSVEERDAVGAAAVAVRTPVSSLVGSLRGSRLAAAAHVVMAVVMAAMLLTMV